MREHDILPSLKEGVSDCSFGLRSSPRRVWPVTC